MSDKTRLSVKEELFVAAIIAGKTATQSAIDAGYVPKNADVTAAKLLKRPHVAAAIQAAKDRITRKYRVTAERVVQEMALIGFSDIGHYTMDAEGFVKIADGAPDGARRAIKKIRRRAKVLTTYETKHVEAKGDEPAVTIEKKLIEYDTEIELWNKDGELHHLGEYLKLFKENRKDGDGRDDGTHLTPEQRRDRVISLLKVAAHRRRQALLGRKQA